MKGYFGVMLSWTQSFCAEKLSDILYIPLYQGQVVGALSATGSEESDGHIMKKTMASHGKLTSYTTKM